MTFGVFYDALDVCIKRYNNAKGTNYTKADLVFDEPVDLRLWPTPHPSKKNTLLVAHAGETKIKFVYDRVDIQATYIGSTTVGYPVVYLWKNCVGTNDTLAELIQYHYAINIEPRDIVPDQFDPSTFNTDTTRTVKIVISPRSYNYLPFSSFYIGIGGRYVMVDGKPMLATTPPTLSGPSQWTEDYAYQNMSLTTRGQPGGVTWGNDYTPVARLLKRFTGWHVYYDGNCWAYNAQSGRAAALYADLCKALTAVDGLPWTFNTATVPTNPATHVPYNLYAAWCVYAGPTKGAIREKAMNYRVPSQFLHLLDGCNPEFDNVLVVYIRSASNLMPACAFFHFNNPKP